MNNATPEEQQNDLECILVGDDNIEFAREHFPPMKTKKGDFAVVDFVSSPKELLEWAQDPTDPTYSIIITDLNYTENGQEGFQVLEALKDHTARKVLWTGNANDAGVRARGESLGALVLDKDQLGTLVGITRNKAPFKKDGKIMVFTGQYEGKFYNAHWEEAIVNSGVVAELIHVKNIKNYSTEERPLIALLSKGEYSFILDLSGAGYDHATGSVTHDLKYAEIPEIPLVKSLQIGEHEMMRLPDPLGMMKSWITTSLQQYVASKKG